MSRPEAAKRRRETGGTASHRRLLACASAIALAIAVAPVAAPVAAEPAAPVVEQADGPDTLAAAVDAGIVSPNVLEALDAGPVEVLVTVRYADVVLDTTDEAGHTAGKETIADRKAAVFGPVPGVSIQRDYEALPISFLSVDSADALLAIVSTGELVSVEEDIQFTTQLAQSLPLINQPAAQSAGHTGAGTAVVVLDTGVDYTHAAFGSCSAPGVPASCRVPFVQDFAPDDGQRDDNGHGTNVTGIVGGVAPGTALIGLDVFDGSLAFSSDVIDGINWAVANQATYDIAAMNLSIGNTAHHTTTCFSSYTAAFASARGAGILPIVAAGNSGSPGGVFQTGVAHPACVAGAVTVGAVYDSNIGGVAWSSCTDVTTTADKVTCFSQTGPLLSLLAPGALITAAGLTSGGTSQAAPHVAGAVAVVAGARPGATVDQIETSLTSSGPNVTDARNGQVNRRLDVLAAVNNTPIALPTVSIGDVAMVEGDGEKKKMSFPVRLSSPASSPVTVEFSAVEGTAVRTGLSDFIGFSNRTLTIPAGETGSRVKVTVLGDARSEADEDFSVVLSSPTGAVLGDDVGLGLIIDDDAPATPQVAVGDVAVVEGDVGRSNAIFDVTLDQVAPGTVTVPWSLSPLSATAGPDYKAASGVVTFPPGTTSTTLKVVVKPDTAAEPDETAQVVLGAPTGATIRDGVGVLTIIDDDSGGLATDVGVGDATVWEGDTDRHPATFTVRLNESQPGPVTVSYAVVAGSATNRVDYKQRAGTLTFPAGARAKTIKVPVVADGLDEGNETFTVVLSNPTGGATLGRSVGLGTILDDDDANAVIGVGDLATWEGDDGDLLVDLPVTLQQPSSSPVTFLVNSATGTATTDFVPKVNKTVTIKAGATGTDVRFIIHADDVVEGDESFTVQLSSPSGATLGRATGTVIIFDDD